MSEDEDQGVARKLRATKRVSELAELMCDDGDEGLGLWKEKGHAALFLAAYAAYAGKKPVKLDAKKNADHKLFDVVNYYSVQKSITDIGELAAIHLACGTADSVDHTLTDLMPGLMEAGANELEDTLRGPDPLPSLLKKIKKP